MGSCNQSIQINDLPYFSNANPYNIRLTQHSYDQTVLGSTTLGTIYTNPLNGNNRHSVYYNDNVGIGTTTPENAENWEKVLEVKGNEHSKIITSSSKITTGCGLTIMAFMVPLQVEWQEHLPIILIV